MKKKMNRIKKKLIKLSIVAAVLTSGYSLYSAISNHQESVTLEDGTVIHFDYEQGKAIAVKKIRGREITVPIAYKGSLEDAKDEIIRGFQIR